jgi:hypothetical protein
MLFCATTTGRSMLFCASHPTSQSSNIQHASHPTFNIAWSSFISCPIKLEMPETRQFTMAILRELWKNEFMPEIRKVIELANDSLRSEICELNTRLDEFEKSQSLLSEKYDQLMEIIQSTKKQMQQIEQKLKDQDSIIFSQDASVYQNMAAIDEINQYQRHDCLEITGIPILADDNPKKLIAELGPILGVQITENDISTAHRLPRTKKIHNHIIVKFVHCDVCEDIYKKRQKLNGKLSSSLPSVNAQIGNSIAQPTKIFINESLTGYRKRLFSKVQEYRHRFGHKFMWTVNGKILLLQAESSTVHCFTTDEEFQKFVDCSSNEHVHT